MKIISHRGNLTGPDEFNENKPEYIDIACNKGYDVEIDVWLIDNDWYLGHDIPQYIISFDYLLNNKFWIHTKNGDAFYELLKNEKLNVFWHTTEDFILTSKKYIWTYPNKYLYPGSICVLPEWGWHGNITDCFGICSDYVDFKYNEK